MAKNGGSAGLAIIVGAILGLVLSTGFMMFAVPALNIMNEGKELQSVKASSTTVAAIYGFNIIPQEVPGINITITTRGHSKLRVNFEASYILGEYPSAGTGGTTEFNVTLSVVGIQNKTVNLGLRTTEQTHWYEVWDNLHMELETEPLPAGTYVIKVYYYSLYEVSPASSQLILFYAGNQIPITMTAIEIGTHSFF